jgi:hypothetical protein
MRIVKFSLLLGLISIVFAVAFFGPGKPGSVGDAGGSVKVEGSAKPTVGRRETSLCVDCHLSTDAFPRARWDFLNARARLSAGEWFQAASVAGRCGGCHRVPEPATLPRKSWVEAVVRMKEILVQRGVAPWSDDEASDLLHYYLAYSPEKLLPLPPDPNPTESPLKYAASPFGRPLNSHLGEHPGIGHIQMADLDGSGHLGLVVCDTDNSEVTWIHPSGQGWQEETIGHVPCPAHTQVFTNRETGLINILVASQKFMRPTDDPIGSVVLLNNQGGGHFVPVVLKEGLSRVVDVEPGDFDGNGTVDFLVSAFGWINEGEVGWLEGKTDGLYDYHRIVKRTGAIHALPVDLDRDGRLDFVVLFAQEHEQISVFLNQGGGEFVERVLYAAPTPAFGSSGIQLVDLDQDGDIDILYTNGDNMDLPTRIPRPFHGVRWLENRGNLEFQDHEIYRFYGAYCAVAGDLNGDGHLDIVAASLFNDWASPDRDSLIWLENNGHQEFTPHGIARAPSHLISVAVGDLGGEGRLDIVVSGLNAFPPFDRQGRVTRWQNLRKRQ